MKLISVWTWLIIHIYECWFMLPLISNLWTSEKFDNNVSNGVMYVALTFMNILFLVCHFCIHKKSYLTLIYSLIVITSLIAKKYYMAGFNKPILYYLINAPFAGLTLILKTPKQFSIVLSVLCVFFILMNINQMLKNRRGMF